jgi:hypothetical protein
VVPLDDSLLCLTELLSLLQLYEDDKGVQIIINPTNFEIVVRFGSKHIFFIPGRSGIENPVEHRPVEHPMNFSL